MPVGGAVAGLCRVQGLLSLHWHGAEDGGYEEDKDAV